MIIHVVKSGDSLYSIGQIYGVSAAKIAEDNEITNPNNLVVGQTIVILEGTRTHTVAPGESVYTIARKYNVSVRDLISANPQIGTDFYIYPGENITIPSETKKFGTIEVNGYAFPGTEMDVLKKTFPSLTYLSIFSTQVNADGSLNTIPDEPLIQAAREANVAPLMVITNLAKEGGFSSDIAHAILSSNAVQDTLLNNVVKTLEEKNYYGLDIDFEYIYPYDRENYNNFLRKAVNKLRPLGYTVTTAVAPKQFAEKKGILYEGHDYPVHGALANHVIIMTYEWGYTFGPPMAVAPLNEVKKVIDYAVTAIPRRKIFMGIPNYGYNWTLPYVKGSRAETVTNVGAVSLAAKVGAQIKYDYISQAPFFNYYDENGREHVVWFEDARSINAKLNLAGNYGLGGVSYWTIGKYFPQNWLVLNSLFDVRKVI